MRFLILLAFLFGCQQKSTARDENIQGMGSRAVSNVCGEDEINMLVNNKIKEILLGYKVDTYRLGGSMKTENRFTKVFSFSKQEDDSTFSNYVGYVLIAADSCEFKEHYISVTEDKLIQ